MAVAMVAQRSRADFAWLAVIPSALAVIAGALLLTEPLSRALYPRSTLTLLPSDLGWLSPEPQEQTRYLLALGGPVAGRWSS
jgi:hypothetical protein